MRAYGYTLDQIFMAGLAGLAVGFIVGAAIIVVLVR